MIYISYSVGMPRLVRLQRVSYACTVSFKMEIESLTFMIINNDYTVETNSNIDRRGDCVFTNIQLYHTVETNRNVDRHDESASAQTTVL
jgi:hypothetical protein